MVDYRNNKLYRNVSVTLTPAQRQTLMTFSDDVLTNPVPKKRRHGIRLAPDRTVGPDIIMVNRGQAMRLEKCRKNKVGCTLHLTPNHVIHNQKGGNLAIIGEHVASVGIPSLLNVFDQADPGEGRIADRLRFLRGNGFGEEPNEAFKLGTKLGKQEKEEGKTKRPELTPKVIKQALSEEKVLNGTGINMLGDGFWEDFKDGFVFGFTKPFEALELLGREIGNAFSGKGNDTNLVFLDDVNDKIAGIQFFDNPIKVNRQSLSEKKKTPLQRGTGIKYY